MATTNEQAEAVQPDLQETVADPLDAVKSTNSGTNQLDEYERERDALLASLDDQTEQGGEPAPEDQPEEQAGDDAADEPEETGEEQDDTEGEGEPETVAPKSRDKMRPRFSDPIDIAVASLAKAKGISLVEAAKAYESMTAWDKPQGQDAPAEARETSESVQTRIEELENLEAQASSDLEFDAANQHRREANRLRNHLIDLKIAEVQEKSASDQRAAQEVIERFHADKDKFLAFYPDAASAFDGKAPSTPMAKEIVRLNAEWREIGDPLYDHPEKAGLLMKEAAKNLGIPMTKPGSAPVKKSVQNRPMQPASGNARTSTTAPNDRLEDAILKATSLDEYEEHVKTLVGNWG